MLIGDGADGTRRGGVGVAAEPLDDPDVGDGIGERPGGEQLVGHRHPGGEAHHVGGAERAEVDPRRRRRIVRTVGRQPHRPSTLVAEQADEEGRPAGQRATEVVHRHHLDGPTAQQGTRDEAARLAAARVAQRQLDHPADVIAQPVTETRRVDARAQQQRRREQRPRCHHHPVGSDHVPTGEDDPDRAATGEPDAVDERARDDVEVAAFTRRRQVGVGCTHRPAGPSRQQGDGGVAGRRQQRAVDQPELRRVWRLARDLHRWQQRIVVGVGEQATVDRARSAEAPALRVPPCGRRPVGDDEVIPDGTRCGEVVEVAGCPLATSGGPASTRVT